MTNCKFGTSTRKYTKIIIIYNYEYIIILHYITINIIIICIIIIIINFLHKTTWELSVQDTGRELDD